MKHKYDKILDDFLREIIYEDWMEESDYEEFITELHKIPSFSKDVILQNIVKNEDDGISVEMTFDYYRKLIKELDN